MTDKDRAADENREILVARVSYVTYQQVTGVLGAFAFVAFFGHFVDFDWRGALKALADGWAEHVRPAVSIILNVTLVRPLAALGVHFEIPRLLLDYATVGFVLFASEARASYQITVRMLTPYVRTRRDLRAFKNSMLFTALLRLPRSLWVIPLWPVAIVRNVDDIVSSARMKFVRQSAWKKLRGAKVCIRTLTLLPVAYLFVLVIANFALSPSLP
jgi:hypothetical protein